jgi:hypothetical protein
VQRELFSVSDIVNMCRALALAADPNTEAGQGYLRALVSLAVAIGAPTADVIPEAPKLTVITSQRRAMIGGGR